MSIRIPGAVVDPNPETAAYEDAYEPPRTS